ncbi:hypothetical protein LINGRAPRIM_LOCUS2035, partial [Linum grandiflorum]
ISTCLSPHNNPLSAHGRSTPIELVAAPSQAAGHSLPSPDPHAAPNLGPAPAEGKSQSSVADQLAELTIAVTPKLPAFSLTELVAEPPPCEYNLYEVGTFHTKHRFAHIVNACNVKKSPNEKGHHQISKEGLKALPGASSFEWNNECLHSC